MRWPGIALLLVAAAGVLFTLFSPRTSAFQPEFAEPAEALLKRLLPGPNAKDVAVVAGEVYEQGGFLFRDSVIRDRFVHRILQLNQTLGALSEVRAVQGEQRMQSRGGDVVRVDFDLAFTRARTSAQVSYGRRQPAEPWRLLGISVQIPESREPFAETVPPDYLSVSVPPVVRERVVQTLAAIRAGEQAALYRDAAPAFRAALGAEEFERRLAAERPLLGNFRRVLAYLDEGMSLDQTRVRIYCLLEYDRSRTTATLEFSRGPDIRKVGARDFQLLSYQLLLPEPVLPARSPESLRPTP